METRSLTHIPLSELLLDTDNPRFGDSGGKFTDQTTILDWIVLNFGIEDVINSLAINGYFDAEPLVVERDKETVDKYIVKEGNRRLAACLILANDPRAANQATKQSSVKHIINTLWSPETKIAAIIFDHGKSKGLTSYLGVRHIVSSQPWDSYAKAAWIAKVVKGQELTVEGIAGLTGDKSQTILKLLEGYNFVQQLIYKGLFEPSVSLRRGRGSNVSYPFSWIYTILQYAAVRNWLGLKGYSPHPNPIPESKELEAAEVLTFMFGNKTQGVQPKLADSREIGNLAYTLSVSERRELLRTGYSLDQINESARPALDKLTSSLVEARQNLRNAASTLAETGIETREAKELIDIVLAIRKSSNAIYTQLNKVINKELGEDDD
ncbi:MAG TPA: hypothetical protein VHB01_04250 [Nitrosospira sp.]|nr:hypothetical protein [Nitrosospira sp.]